MRCVDPLFQLLYVSQMAPGCDFGVVKDIVSAARLSNTALGISGALLFDGERFCELIEGAEADVRSLIDRIAGDSRHTGLTVVFSGHSLSGRAMTRWASGYCEPDELAVFVGDTGLRGQPALDALVSILAGADTD